MNYVRVARNVTWKWTMSTEQAYRGERDQPLVRYFAYYATFLPFLGLVFLVGLLSRLKCCPNQRCQFEHRMYKNSSAEKVRPDPLWLDSGDTS